METTLPLQQKERLFILDAIRGIALCGILILNIYYFARPLQAERNLLVYNETSPANVNAWYLTNFLVEGSYRGLFSMLFGAGVILLVGRLEKKQNGLSAADVYYRRIIWLLLFGLANAYVLLWIGDILYMYAICGLFLFPFRNSSVKLLLVLAVFFMAITMFKNWQRANDRLALRKKGEAALALQKQKKTLTDDQQEELKKWKEFDDKRKPENIRKVADREIAKMQQSYAGVWEHLAPTIKVYQSLKFYNGFIFDILIFVFLGMAFYKMGILTGDRPLWLYATFVVIGYTLGFGWGLLEGNAYRQSNFEYFKYLAIRPIKADLYQLHRIFVVCGHIGIIMLAWKSGWFTPYLKLFANVGQMAFTNYLMQSIIGTLIFHGYGLAYFGKFERYELWYFVGGIWIFQIIFSALWLKYFLYGPLEWVWRSLTYWKKQPMLKTKEVSMALA